MLELNKIYQGDWIELAKQLDDESIVKYINTQPHSNGMSVYEYLAGIIDGEGYIGIRKSTYGIRVRKDCKNPVYSERIQIKMNRPECIDLLKQTFGGHIFKEKKIYQSVKGFHTNNFMYVYSATDKIAFNIVKKILPYSLIKKEQLSCLLKLRESKESKIAQRRGSPASYQMNNLIIEYREKLYQEVKRLNA